ncbi:hypothetical protein BFW91_02085 [Pseudomonas fluorescens]|uniref:hypothetical protein n=1 Tax=Pseudomonas fluorescens TaxID=294 RepID=UPI00099DC05F|nr:hypothetical protein [Pseudomonas fluorescens]OPB16898.1 hypothetical protein BFW91_02085 [Pseudomonas fluorescens]
MPKFKIIQSTLGYKYVVNLARIDMIVFLHDGTAKVRMGGGEIIVDTATGELLEAELGPTE